MTGHAATTKVREGEAREGEVGERSSSIDKDRAYQQGIVAGLIGAVTIAVWFLIIDLLRGRPLLTPTVLGTALFRRGEGLAAIDALPVSLEMVAMYTWVHGLVFCCLGGLASRLLVEAERRPNVGFGIILLFVVFEAGFLGVALLLAEPVLQALRWPAILVGNLLAAATMGWYFWRKHPHLRIEP